MSNQMREESMFFKVVNDEGKEIECETLFTFESDETGKSYIVYTDNTVDEEGNTKVYNTVKSLWVSANSRSSRRRLGDDE